MGKTRRSFIHISDVNSALYKIMKNGKIGETYHISTNKYVSLKQLTDEIIVLMKINNKSFLKLSKKDRVGKDHRYHLSSNKLSKEIKWSSKIKLEEGLLDTLKWINLSYNKLRNEKLIYEHKKYKKNINTWWWWLCWITFI